MEIAFTNHSSTSTSTSTTNEGEAAVAELKRMHQRITNLSRFMRGEYMDQHMQPESKISPHCMKCALTSLNGPEFKEKCEHDKSTERVLNEPGALWADRSKERLEMGPNSKTKKEW